MSNIIRFVPPTHPMGVKSVSLSWHVLQERLWNLAGDLALKYPDIIDAIIVTRGGLSVGHMLITMLKQRAGGKGIRNIETFSLESYDDGREHNQISVHKWPCGEWLGAVGSRTTFVFDEVADSGITARFVRRELARFGVPNTVFVVAVTKPEGKSAVDHYAVEVEQQDLWVDFPWDRVPQEAGGPPMIEKF